MSDKKIILDRKYYHDGQVMIVAVKGMEEDWAAYIGYAKSKIEDTNQQTIAKHGNKLTKEQAKTFFPYIELRYRD